MTVLIEPDGELAELLQSTLGARCVVLGSSQQLEPHLTENPAEYAVILGPSLTMPDAMGLAERYRVTRPAVSMILVRAHSDSAVLTESLRAGIREVIDGADLTTLPQAVQRAQTLAQAISNTTSMAVPEARPVVPLPTGQIFTIFSTKGGVGKTTLTTNLGAALADRGKRVCIVDLDVHSGDVAIMLQLFPTRTLSELSSLRGAIDIEGARSLVTEHSPGLSVIAAPLGVDGRDQVVADDVTGLLQTLRCEFDVVLIDTSGTFDDYSLNALDVSDLIILVGTLDIPSLKNLKLATSTLELLNIDRKLWRLVLNRADSRVGLSQDEFKQTLGLDIAASIPSSREVLASVNRGESIVRAQPRHEVSKMLYSLASRLAAISEPLDEATGGKVAVPGRRRGLFRSVLTR